MKKSFLLIAALSLLIFSCNPAQDRYTGYNGIYRTAVDGKEFRLVTDSSATIKIDTVPVIVQADFEYVRGEFIEKNNEVVLVIKLNDTGKLKFAALTRENTGKPIAVILNNELVSMPVVETEIPNGLVSISGLDKKRLIDLVKYFNP